jgi:hypothetical protein
MLSVQILYSNTYRRMFLKIFIRKLRVPATNFAVSSEESWFCALQMAFSCLFLFLFRGVRTLNDMSNDFLQKKRWGLIRNCNISTNSNAKPDRILCNDLYCKVMRKQSHCHVPLQINCKVFRQKIMFLRYTYTSVWSAELQISLGTLPLKHCWSCDC